MPRSYRKNILRTLRSTKSRFIAIFSIVALGVGFLAGLMSTTPDMKDSMEQYLDGARLYDIRLVSTMGLTEDDVAWLQTVEGVSAVQPAYSIDVLMQVGEDTVVTRALSLPAVKGDPTAPGALNQLELLEGRWPAAPDECVVTDGVSIFGGTLAMGATITVSPDNEDLTESLPGAAFTVVGRVRSPLYFSIEREPASVGNGSVGMVLYLPQSAFAYDVYTEVYLTVAEAFPLMSLEKDYDAAVQTVIDRLKAAEAARCQARLDGVIADARVELDDGWAQYYDAKQEAEDGFAKAEAELEDARQKLADGEKKYQKGQKELADAEKPLADGQAVLDQSYGQLVSGQAQLDAYAPTIKELRAQYTEGVAKAAQILGLSVQETEALLDRLEAMAPADRQDPAQVARILWEAVEGKPPTEEQWQALLDTLTDIELSPEEMEQMRDLLEQWLEQLPPAGDGSSLAQRLEELLAIEDPEEFAQALGELLKEYGDTLTQEQWQDLLQALQNSLQDYRQDVIDQIGALVEGILQLRAALREFDSQAAQLQAGWVAYYAGVAELEDARQQITDGRRELRKAWQEIEDGRRELADGEAEYAQKRADAEAELADAEAELLDAEAELAKLEPPTWYIWNRNANVSFSSFAGNVSKVEAIARVFPIFFFLVAALVVSTTMTRMVEEERLQIGTMKAMGYARTAIMQKYILYALAAAISGAVVGLAFGFAVFPSVIWYAYEMMYYMPHLDTPWRANYAALAGGLLIGCALVTTLSACQATLRETPAALMRPRAPKAGKRILLERISPLWRRLPFTYKVTFRNLLRYKKRFWMTVIGVAGCTALLVTGFGISDSLNGIALKQYGEIYNYDLLTAVTSSKYTQTGAIHDYLFTDPAFAQSMAACTELVSQTMPDGSLNEVYLMTPQNAAGFAAFADLHERIGRAPTPLTDDGVVVTEKLAETMGVKAGDTVTLENTDGRRTVFTVTGVCEHYVMNYVYIGPAAYRAGFGTEPTWNTVLSLLTDDSDTAREVISARLLAMEGIGAVNFTTDQMNSVLNMLNSINAVVVLIIVCAASLAFVVLYNLTNINIAERVKEIATIKVLGFYDREVSAYVNRESVLLAIIGALFGLVGGIWLHKFIIYTVEVDAVMFGRDIHPRSFVIAFVLTMVFSVAVDLFMGRRLKQISMVESMKAPE